MANLFAGLLKQAQPAINAGNNVLQDLGILRPQATNLKDVKRVEDLKTRYATKELPKKTDKAVKQVSAFYDDLAQKPEYANRIEELERVKKGVNAQIQTKALQKQELALTGVAPDKINQFSKQKAQIDIKKQVGQPLNTQEQTIDSFSNPLNAFGAGLLGKTNQFVKDLNTGLDTVMSYEDQAVRSVPIIGQGIKALDNFKLNQINQDLNKDISADQRIDLLKRKSQLEATPQIQRQAIKADYKKPTLIENAQNKTLGSKELGEGLRQTGGYQAGEVAGEILPFAFGGEITGAAKLATGGTKALMGTSIGKALAKYGGKETVEVLTKGAIENALLEQPVGLIQEGAKVAGGEQSLGQAAQNQLGRTALAAGLGGVAELGIDKIGKGFNQLGRAKKFEEVQAQRQAVQGERQARDSDIEQVQNALQMQEQGQAVEALMPNFKTKIAQNTASQAQKDINQTITNAQKTVAQQAKEEAQLQTALNRLEQKSVKAENAQYKQEAQIGKQAVKEVNQTIKQAEKDALIKLRENFKVKRLQEAQVREKGAFEVKKAQSQLKYDYKNALSDELQLSERPLRDGLEELGFEIRTTRKDSFKDKIAGAKAANDIRAGGTSVDGMASEFLDDIQANKYLDEFDGEAAYKHKKFNDDLNNAKTYEELEKLGEEHNDLNDPIQAKREEEFSEASALDETLQNPKVDSTQISQPPLLKSQEPLLNSRELPSQEPLNPLPEATQQSQLPKSINQAENLAIKAGEKPNTSTNTSELPNRTNAIQDSTLSGKVPEAPKSDLIQKPENLTGQTKERGLIQTINENPNIPQALKDKLKNSPEANYQIRNTKDLFERASERVKTQDAESLAKEIRMKSRNEGNWTDEEVATGYELARKYEAEGLLDEAAEIEEALAKKATEGGQMIQAYAKYGKMTPEGAVREANKVLEKAMPPAKAKQLKEATANVIKDFNKANKKAVEDILNFCPPGSFA